MCGRIIQSGSPELPGLKVVLGTPDDSRIRKPRYNGAPSQLLRVIRRHPETGEDRIDLLQWGLVPYWVKDAKGGRKPINARAEGDDTTQARVPRTDRGSGFLLGRQPADIVLGFGTTG